MSGPGPIPVDRRTFLLIAVGGAVGAVVRTLVTEHAPRAPGRLSVTTLAVNLVGALLLGVLMGHVSRRAEDRWRRPLLAVGLLGGFTTFSTLCVDAARLTASGATGTALIELTISLIGGIAAVAVGVAIASIGHGGHHLADEGES